jgi:hypothetical protein
MRTAKGMSAQTRSRLRYGDIRTCGQEGARLLAEAEALLREASEAGPRGGIVSLRASPVQRSV